MKRLIALILCAMLSVHAQTLPTVNEAQSRNLESRKAIFEVNRFIRNNSSDTFKDCPSAKKIINYLISRQDSFVQNIFDYNKANPNNSPKNSDFISSNTNLYTALVKAEDGLNMYCENPSDKDSARIKLEFASLYGEISLLYLTR